MRTFFADLGQFCLALYHHWKVGVTGGSIAVLGFAAAVYGSLSNDQLRNQKIIQAVGILALGYILCAAFYAWREERKKNHARSRDTLLRMVLDRIIHHVVALPPGLVIFSTNPNTDFMGALVKSFPDFGSEADVTWVCQEIDTIGNNGSDPFIGFEFLYGNHSFKGIRLRFLRDAYMRGNIFTDNDARLYLKSEWADKNGLKELSDDELRRSYESDPTLRRSLLRGSLERVRNILLSRQ